MSMDPLVGTNIISRSCPGTPVVIILQRGPFSLSGRMIYAWSLSSMQCHSTFGLLSHSGTRSILACNGDVRYADIVVRPRSCALCCPVHASNLEGPGTLVPAFYLATSIVLRPSRRLGDTKSRHQPLICASIEGPDRPC
jgi:hypothetical protein